jgi:hypothetical protein
VEHSLTFTRPYVAVDELEGEDDDSKVKSSSPSSELTTDQPEGSTAPEEPRTPPHMSSPGIPSVPEAPRSQRIRKPSQYVQDICKGEGSTTGLHKPFSFPVGL